MFSISRFFRSRQSQPCIRDRSLVDSFMQAELEAAAWNRARFGNREPLEPPNEVSRDQAPGMDGQNSGDQEPRGLLGQSGGNRSRPELDSY